MTVTDVVRTVFKKLRRFTRHLIEPLTVDDELQNFRLSIPETQTTTVDGDIGWGKRPPAVLECPRCDSEIHQLRSIDTIDCPRCVAELSAEQFPELELLYLRCPICRNRMQHGKRHPEAFDIPEWATCDDCHYHWEFQHF